MKRKSLYCYVSWAVIALSVAGCSTTRDWNPYVNLENYEVVVVEDFQDGGLGIGRAFADQLASELLRRGAFAEVRRQRAGLESIVLSGVIQDYVEGDVASRIKYGHGVGEAVLAVAVRVSVDPSLQFVGDFSLRESTLQTSPDARRTGREDMDWLRQHVVERIADVLLKERARSGRN